MGTIIAQKVHKINEKIHFKMILFK